MLSMATTQGPQVMLKQPGCIKLKDGTMEQCYWKKKEFQLVLQDLTSSTELAAENLKNTGREPLEMDEGGGKDSKIEVNGGGGDASELHTLREADNAVSSSAKLKTENINMTRGVLLAAEDGKCAALMVEEVTDSQLKISENASNGQDVEMGATSEAKGMTENHCRQMAGPSPPGDSENKVNGENLCVDSDDAVLNLDDSVEKNSSLDIIPGRVELGTVLSSSSPPLSKTVKNDTENTQSTDSERKNSMSEESKNSREKKTYEASMPTASSVASSHSDVISREREEESKAVAPDELPDTLSDSDDMLDSDDDNDEGAGVVNSRLLSARQKNILRRRRLIAGRFGRHQLASSSDSLDDTNSDGNDDDNDQTNKESENDEEIQRVVQGVLDKPMPGPNWFALRELRKREYCNTGRLGSSWFREGVQGSLHMVRRLVTVKRMELHEGCVNALSFNRIGTLLASGSDDLNVVLWNWQKARPSVSYESGHRSNVFQAKFMPFSGDCHVISCARDGQVRLAELNSMGVCKATRKLAQHRGAAHKLALELDSPHVFLSCGEDALTFLFDLRQEKPHKLVTAKENDKKVPLYSIHSNPCDSYQFCVGGRDHYIRVYDKRKISEQSDGGVLKKLCPDHLVTSDLKANVTCAIYNYNGSEILGTYNDEDIYLFDNTMSDGANYIHKYAGHRNNATVKGVNFYGPKSQFIVSGSDCGYVYFWDKETEAIINFQKGDDTGVINVLEPHPTLPVLATSGLDHDVKLWMPMLEEPNIDWDLLKKTMKKNQVERNLERCTSEPEIGGQMLWFIMNHFRNSARRRLREEGQELSSSDDEEEDSNSDDSEGNQMRCAQS
ncbi:Ddb1- and cul4-associated factor 8-like [Plakobranchus ocellatus]|uniref:Ddb1- and cul4-associated factor 8-like n=1 Tax=Plakobranchus ocellatus TaxID=259542 RepID=A0AAV3YWM5_9GAST|nr:Ddb1- and cul4-associated factor 8-like [Plakobranchus ocellatus]